MHYIPGQPSHYGDPDSAGAFEERPAPLARDFHARAFTVGIGGPVGSGKTALLLALCRALRDDNNIAVVTNDIFTREDAEFLTRHQALAPERIAAVETGGCPHTAVRDDISQNLDALQQLMFAFQPELLFVESGGDNLAAQFSRELADFTIYVIDVSGGDKIPRKGGPGHHPVGPADHQQDGPGAARRRRPRRDGARRAEDARHRAVPVHAGDARHRHPRDRAAHPGGARRRREGGAGVGWTGPMLSDRGVDDPARRRRCGASHSADGPRRRYRFVGPPASSTAWSTRCATPAFVEPPAQVNALARSTCRRPVITPRVASRLEVKAPIVGPVHLLDGPYRADPAGAPWIACGEPASSVLKPIARYSVDRPACAGARSISAIERGPGDW